MNLGWFGVPPSGGPNGLDRPKPGLQAVRGFMVPMHGHKTVGAFHDPTHLRPLPRGERAFVHAMSVPLLGGVRGGFMVPMHGIKVVRALHEPLKAPPGFGVRRQSAGATALWISSKRRWKCRAHVRHDHTIKSGVALRFPPHSKTLARWLRGAVHILCGFMVPMRDSGIVEAAHDNERHRE